MSMNKIIFEKSVKNRFAYSLPECDVPEYNMEELIPSGMLRKSAPELPELSEVDVLRHYVDLSGKNHGVLSGFYPLGSCTMKYNPAVNEDISRFAGFACTHPLIGDENSQGSLRLMFELQGMLSEITGMDAFSLQPSAGSHGELAGLMIIKSYHERNGGFNRTKILVPDSSHGTNPASVSMAGLETVHVKSDADGNVDIDDLLAKTDSSIAGLMLTNPSTLGLFEVNIHKISKIIHDAGGLLYYDGANLNAIMGICRPGDMGFDVMHINLHKTFSTPHGGGGPGAGPVGVKSLLAPYLPSPIVVRDFAASGSANANGSANSCINEGDGNGYGEKGRWHEYRLNYDMPLSIGQVRSFYGNFGILARAYAYILSMGSAGLKSVSENAVLNANYLMFRLKGFMDIAFDRICMHEFVATGLPQKAKGVSALDIAKRMLDFSVHPPTVYFPLIVKEAMMFEPTETECKQSIDDFVEIMRQIIREAEEEPELLKNAPHNTSVGRLDDVKAARKPVLIWDSGC